MHRSLSSLRLLVRAACAFLGLALPVRADDPPRPNAALQALSIDGGTVVSAQRETAPGMTIDTQTLNDLPPRTVVKIVLHPAPGSTIQVEIWLPDAERWNGRFLALGNGGSAGAIHPGGLAGKCSGGYAVATTDMGTAPNSDSGIGNPEVWKDFGFRATHLMTVVSKQVVRAFYGKDPDYSYFNGGSTGGQQALQEAQRYPDDYDGIAAAVPAHDRTPLHAYFLWNDQILRQCPFTPSQTAAVVAAGNEYMASREIPPTAGKLVSDPRHDAKDIEAVVALARQKDPTLTAAHAEALRKLFDGPRRAGTGERIFDGIPFGASFDGAHGNLYLFQWVFGKDRDPTTIDFGNDIDAYTAALGPYLNADNPDLSAFERRGGKLLMLSGTADPVVPYPATLDYYEKVVERFGGDLAKVQSFFRYYLVPGMDHGTGGPGINRRPDILALVVDWREKGAAPDRIVAQRVVDGKTELQLPLYPYPEKTEWDSAAASFVPLAGPRGGVDRIAARFLPPASE